MRLGLEDDIYYSTGVRVKTNAELVEGGTLMAKEFGGEITSPKEARKILSLREPFLPLF